MAGKYGKGKVVIQYECGHKFGAELRMMEHKKYSTTTLCFTLDSDNDLSENKCPACGLIRLEAKGAKI